MCDEVEKKKYVTQVHGVGPAPCLGGAFAGARQLSGMEALIGWIGVGAAGGPGATQPHEPLLGRWVASRRAGRSEREVLPSKQARRSGSMVNFISTKTRHQNTTTFPWRLLSAASTIFLAFQKPRLLKILDILSTFGSDWVSTKSLVAADTYLGKLDFPELSSAPRATSCAYPLATARRSR